MTTIETKLYSFRELSPETEYYVIDGGGFRSGPFATIEAARQSIMDAWEQDGSTDHISETDARNFHGWETVETWTDGYNGAKSIVQ